MTGLGDERTQCATHPAPSVVPPVDAVLPLPPPIQGAERRTERGAPATGSRWGLRVLVVGGLAGAVWLLTGAAAHAADRADEPIGSLLGSVVGGDVTAPVSGLLTAAARPLEAKPAHHRQKHNVVADILEVPQRVLNHPVATLSEVSQGVTVTTVDTVGKGVDKVTGEVAEPLRPTGGPAVAQHRPTAVTEPVTPDAEPVTEQPQRPAVTPDEAESPQARPATPASLPIIKPFRAPVAAVKSGVTTRQMPNSATLAHRHAVPHRAVAAPATTAEDLPGGDGPAPLQLHLGDVSGTPTSGSGTPTEGGSAAFLPAAMTSSTMACQRLPIASDVEVRRTDAEAPTVSPD